MEKPTTLYHGSMYKQTELMPGYKRSGKLQTWDGIESNLNLYVSSDKREAELLGIGSAIEKTFDSNRFVEYNGNIWVYTRDPISIDELLNMEVYVYTIPFRDTDEWIKNTNPYNNIDTEWITRKTIKGVKVHPINIRSLMRGKTITLTTAPPDVRFDQLSQRYASETVVHKF